MSSPAFFRISATRLSAGSSGPFLQARLNVTAARVSESALNFAEAASREVAHRLTDSFDDLIEEIAVLLEIFLALGRDVIDLLPLGIHRADVSLVLEELERRVYGAGGGGVDSRSSSLPAP